MLFHQATPVFGKVFLTFGIPGFSLWFGEGQCVRRKQGQPHFTQSLRISRRVKGTGLK